MRLTLRTLLAYLDDTLPPSEIKSIGEKVAESPNAQELIARLKSVTRRRRLMAPPAAGPGSLEPNQVAEYLDNVLEGEEIAEIERLCLESDVHLAEIAACHQILTLVLGEQATVPPKARERMYGLVKGKEAIPYRKAAPARKPSDDVSGDEVALGLAGGWLKWVLPAAAVLLVGALGLAVWSFLPDRPDKNTDPLASNTKKDGAKPDDKGKEEDPNKDKTRPKDNGKIEQPDKDKGKATIDPNKDKGKPKDSGKVETKDSGKDNGKIEIPKVVERRPPPSKTRVVAGNFTGGYDEVPGVLLARRSGETGPEKWTRIVKRKPDDTVYTDDTLLTLPGFANILKTGGGVEVLMRGSVPEFPSVPGAHLYLLETAVVLHESKDVDLDMTLLRGRIYLTNRKDTGPAKVRLRFGEKEVWDITLAEPRDEAAAELTRLYTFDINPAEDEPRTEFKLVLIRGAGTVNVNGFDEFTQHARPPRAVLFPWNNATRFRNMESLDELPPEWNKLPPLGKEELPGQARIITSMTNAIKSLSVRLQADKKEPAVAIREARVENEVMIRLLSIYCMGAIDNVDGVIDAVGDEAEIHAIDRDKASFTLRQWMARGQGQHKLLYDAKNSSGLLLKKFKKESEAKTFYDLLFMFPSETWDKPETFEALARTVQSPQVGIAELGYQHLMGLSRGQVKYPPFNAAMALEDRKKFGEFVFDLVDKKQLPPRAPAPKDKGGK